MCLYYYIISIIFSFLHCYLYVFFQIFILYNFFNVIANIIISIFFFYISCKMCASPIAEFAHNVLNK